MSTVELLTTEQVAQKAKVSARTVAYAIVHGNLKAMKFGTRGKRVFAYGVAPEDAEAWIKARREAKR
jgi:hypothetical protein